MSVIRQFTIRVNSDTRDAMKGLVAVGGALYGLQRSVRATARFFSRMVMETANVGDAAAVTASQLGLTSQSWQELAHVADISGVPIGRFRTFLRRMGDNLVDAQKGTGQAVSALERLYGSVDKAPTDQLEAFLSIHSKLYEELQKPGGLQTRGGLLAQIGGRAGGLTAPIFDMSPEQLQALVKEARDLGLVLDPDVTQATQKFNDEVLRLRKGFEGIRNVIGARLLPQVTKAVSILQLWVREQRALILAALEPWLNGVEFGIKLVTIAIDRVRRAFKQFIRPLEVTIKLFSSLTMVLGGAAIAASVVGGLMAAAGAALLFAKTLKLVRLGLLLTWPLLSPILGWAFAFAAVVAGLVLVVEDFITFLRGGESALGDFLDPEGDPEKFLEFFRDLKELLGEIKDLFDDLARTVKDFFKPLTDELNRLLFIDPDIQTGEELKRLAAQYPQLKLTQARLKVAGARALVQKASRAVDFDPAAEWPEVRSGQVSPINRADNLFRQVSRIASPTRRSAVAGPSAFPEVDDLFRPVSVQITNNVRSEDLPALNGAQIDAAVRAGAEPDMNQ